MNTDTMQIIPMLQVQLRGALDRLSLVEGRVEEILAREPAPPAEDPDQLVLSIIDDNFREFDKPTYQTTRRREGV